MYNYFKVIYRMKFIAYSVVTSIDWTIRYIRSTFNDVHFLAASISGTVWQYCTWYCNNVHTKDTKVYKCAVGPGTIHDTPLLQNTTYSGTFHTVTNENAGRMRKNFSSKEGHKTVIGVSPALRQCQKGTLRSNLEGDTPWPEFFSKWAGSVLARGVNPSCDVVWPVLTCSDMSTGYAASTSIKVRP